MKNKKLFKLSAIILGIITLCSFNKIYAVENIFDGNNLTRSSAQAYTRTTFNNSKILCVIKERESQNAYTWNPNTVGEARVVWKIAEKDSSNSKDYSNLYYCLNAERGFVADNGEAVETRDDEYSTSLEMKDLAHKTSIINYSGGELGTNYDKVLWILDNSYIPGESSNQDKVDLLSKAYEYGEPGKFYNNLSETLIDNNSNIDLTDEQIEVVQQLAIWHFTNEYNVTADELYKNEDQINGIGNNYNLDGFGTRVIEGEIVAWKMNALYNYFVQGAPDIYSPVTPELELTSADSEVIESGDYYIAGPFELSKSDINISDVIVKLNNTDLSDNDYILTASTASNTNLTNYNNLNTFYLKINKDKINSNSNISIEAIGEYSTKELTFMTDVADANNTQPVVLVKEVEEDENATTNIEIKLKQITVEKKWIDNDNQDDYRPNSIKVRLYKDDTKYQDITLNQSNDWKHTWNKLLDGSYTIKELNASNVAVENNSKYDSKYTATYNITDTKTTITNTYIPGKVSLEVVKKWNDQNNKDGIRPDNVVVKLYKTVDGQKEEVATKRLDNTNDWIHTWTDLDEKNNGKTILYSVEEEPVEEYTTQYSAEDYSNTDKIVITNSHIPVEITGKYNVVLRKVDENGNILRGSEFKVNGIEYELATGETVIKEDTDIESEEDIPLTYIIEETVVPQGYTGIQSTFVNLVAKVKENGNNYNLKSVSLLDDAGNTITEGNISAQLEGNTIVIIVKNTPVEEQPKEQFDLALRKFITKVNNIEYSRAPVVDTSKLGTVVDGKKVTTAIYKHTKEPIAVQKGDIVTYTIRVYNEGQIDGYVNKITDYIPENLIPIIVETEGIDQEKYAEEIEFNLKWGWIVSEDGKSVTTVRTAKESAITYSELEGYENVTDTKLDAFVEGSNQLDYIDVQIKCLVADTATSYEYLTNIAEITEAKSINDIEGDGLDSTLRNADVSNLSDYKNQEAINSNTNSYVPGQEDDDDFEKIVVKEFDLSLRKYITKVNEVMYVREPIVDTSKLGTVVNGKTITTATYNHTKEKVIVKTGDVVTYKIRIYNEGTLEGFANEITDNIPEGLEFLVDSETNKLYDWKMLDSEGNETKELSEATKIITSYLSDAKKENIINHVTEENGKKVLDYKDVEVQFKVVAEPKNLQDNVIVNEAQISADSDREIDSNPSREEKYNYNSNNNEDDIDYEPIKLQYFDLALRKFITKVNSTDYNNRYPEVNYNEDGSITYAHTKDPVLVTTNDIVVYTIRVYNEGEIAGYATEIKDNLPEGLAFDPENEINKQYNWKMLDSEGKITEDTSKVTAFSTDYLKDQLIDEFKNENGKKILTYKDVQIAFKVIEANTSDRILVNIAQISNDSNDDIDSIPNNNIETEDDLDKEYVRVQYFDLSLKKWVTRTEVTYNGKTTTTKTGFNEDEDKIAKVDLVAKKMTKTTVKFAFNIKVTNEGELPGYAYEVKDYIPKGLKFVAEDNKDWKELEDGTVVTEKLKDTLLKPGESATVEIVLTWKNSTTNTGLKTNYAEISKDSADDKDSVPDNYDFTEDDIDEAQVILSIKTAGAPTYIGLVLITVAILAGGIVLIKKYVID